MALTRNLGRKAAFEMLVTGEFIDADQALEKGLVNRVVDAEQLDAEIEALAAAIAAKPRVAVALGKRLFYRQLEAGIAAAYEDAAQTMACNMMEDVDARGRSGLHREAPAGLERLRRGPGGGWPL